MASIFTYILIIASINQVYSLDILGIFPYSGKSHFFVFSKYLEELAKRGHNVTVISHFPEKQPIANYRTISLAGTTKIVEDEIPAEKSLYTKLAVGVLLNYFAVRDCEVMMANEQVRELIPNSHFDLVIIEQFNSDCGLGIAYKLKTPVIGITSHVLMPVHLARFGIPAHPAYDNHHFLEGGTKPSLYQRVERTIFDVYLKILYHFGSQLINQRTLAKYYDDIPSLEQLARDIKMVLVYTNFVLTGPKLFPPNVIEIGGFHVAKPKPLTGELKKFFDEAKNGVIYISFGSVIKSSTLAKDKVEAIIEVINELPYRFVWKWEDENLKVDEDKLFISKWLPQTDILAHPNTKAFYSHAGMLGTTEAIHYGVPIVAMAIVGDQPSNAASIEESGLGVHIEIGELTKETLLNAFNTILKPSFRENVKRVSAAWHDRPMSPMDTAIYWTEYVAKHPNITYKHPASEVPLYQHLMLDVYLVLITIIVSFVIVIKYSCSYCCRRKKQEKTKKTKKNKIN